MEGFTPSPPLPSLFREEQEVDIGINLAMPKGRRWFLAVFQNSKQQAKHAEIERKYNKEE